MRGFWFGLAVLKLTTKFEGKTLTFELLKDKTDRKEHYIQQFKTSSSAFTLLYDGLGLKDNRN